MRTAFRRAVGGAVLVLALSVAAGPAAADVRTTMVFGKNGVGTGCIPGELCSHDASFHALDKIEPRSTTVGVGDSVSFVIAEGQFHQVAIYEAGTMPSDVVGDPSLFPFLTPPAGPLAPGQVLRADPLAPASYTFASPGRYLVICNIAPHFEFANMWAWVNVR